MCRSVLPGLIINADTIQALVLNALIKQLVLCTGNGLLSLLLWLWKREFVLCCMNFPFYADMVVMRI